MYELMHLQFARQRHEKMMREAEQERLATEAKKSRKKRANRHWTSELSRLGGRLFKSLRARKTAS